MPNYSEKDLQRFLNLVKQLESSGGKNTNHRTIASGIHEGESAYGPSALMPKTISELANRNRLQGQNDPIDDQILENNDQDNIKNLMSQYPEKLGQYETGLATKVMNNAKGDPTLAATGWLYGHNLPENKLKQKLASDPDYEIRIDREMDADPGMSEEDTAVYDVPELESARFMKLKKMYSRGK